MSKTVKGLGKMDVIVNARERRGDEVDPSI